MTMAKIGTLEVNTLHIANQAITGSADAPISSSATVSVSVSVPNVGGLPVQLYFKRTAHYGGTHSNDQGYATATLTRVRDGAVLYTRSITWFGNTTGAEAFDGQVLDAGATTSETYTFTMDVGFFDGDGVQPRPEAVRGPTGFLSALWYKK